MNQSVQYNPYTEGPTLGTLYTNFCCTSVQCLLLCVCRFSKQNSHVENVCFQHKSAVLCELSPNKEMCAVCQNSVLSIKEIKINSTCYICIDMCRDNLLRIIQVSSIITGSDERGLW